MAVSVVALYSILNSDIYYAATVLGIIEERRQQAFESYPRLGLRLAVCLVQNLLPTVLQIFLMEAYTS